MRSWKPRKHIISRKRGWLSVLNTGDTLSKRRNEVSLGFCYVEVIGNIKVSIFKRMVGLEAIWGELKSKWRSRSEDKTYIDILFELFAWEVKEKKIGRSWKFRELG